MNEFFSPLAPSDAIILSLKWFCSGVFSHLILCRLTGTPKYMAKGLFSGFLLVLCLILWQASQKSLNLSVIYYVFTLWLAYLMFFVNLLNSITLKMLDFLAKNGGELDSDGFKAVFGGDSGISSRIEAIKRNNFLVEDKGCLRITAKGKILVYSIKFLRKIIGITEAG